MSRDTFRRQTLIECGRAIRALTDARNAAESAHEHGVVEDLGQIQIEIGRVAHSLLKYDKRRGSNRLQGAPPCVSDNLAQP